MDTASFGTFLFQWASMEARAVGEVDVEED